MVFAGVFVQIFHIFKGKITIFVVRKHNERNNIQKHIIFQTKYNNLKYFFVKFKFSSF